MKKQKIKCNNKGSYVTHYGIRIYLDEVMRADNNEDEKIELSKKYDSHINDIAIGYYSNNYKVYILGYDYDGDAIGAVEFINN